MADVPALQMTVAARVADQLRSEIRQGALDAGMPLRQNEIASRLGVSSTPVREAFQILERMGLVVREGRRGVRVFRPSMQDLVNGYEVRGALESMAARMAALRLSEPELAAIADTMRVMHAPRVSQKKFLQLNAQFHAQIGTASGNAHSPNSSLPNSPPRPPSSHSWASTPAALARRTRSMRPSWPLSRPGRRRGW